MSLTVKCRCGKAFLAKEELAGRRVACPSCGDVITIPSSAMNGPQNANNTDPFGSLGSNSFPNHSWNDKQLPPMPVSSPLGDVRTKKNSSRNLLWIVLGTIGGFFLLVFLACAGLFALGVNRASKELAAKRADESRNFQMQQGADAGSSSSEQTLLEARAGHNTVIVKRGEFAGPPDDPTGTDFDLKQYKSPVGNLAAYLTKDPGDGRKHPAIIWITGGDCNSIGDVWSPQDRSNDQSAAAFRQAGVVMMFPSLRGGNANPGRREGFYGEVDDILAAANYLEQIPYVDPNQIYLGGHSTGGTMVMVVAACSDRFKAVFALGPVAAPSQYGGAFLYCNVRDKTEIALRSPILWLHCVKSPMYVVEGGNDGNWDAIEAMVKNNSNPQIRFFKAPRHDHFSVIAPFTELVAQQIVNGKIAITQQSVNQL